MLTQRCRCASIILVPLCSRAVAHNLDMLLGRNVRTCSCGLSRIAEVRGLCRLTHGIEDDFRAKISIMTYNM